MRIVFLSDLHLGNAGPFDIHGGGEALPTLLDGLSTEVGGVRVVFNGDTFDFLMNEDPLALERERAAAQATAIVAANGPFFVSLGAFLARGGEAELRLGNHDVELAVPEVQAVFRAACHAAGTSLTFVLGDAPQVIEVGGVRVLYTHGEHSDAYNRVDYAHLRPGAAGAPTSLEEFAFPPGSLLVKHTLNPAKRASGLRFIDLLKPDVQGALLAALAVKPWALRHIVKPSFVRFVIGKLENQAGPLPFVVDSGEDHPDAFTEALPGVADALGGAGLTPDEAAELVELLDPEGGPMAFGAGGGVLGGLVDAARTARAKTLRAALGLYARGHRWAVGASGAAYFALDPDDAEWAEAIRLAEKFDVRAVVLGHSHSARFRDAGGVAYLNTGTWAYLMALPSADADVETWARFLEALAADPDLADPESAATRARTARLTWAELSAAPGGGASLTLFELVDGQAVRRAGSLLTHDGSASHLPDDP